MRATLAPNGLSSFMQYSNYLTLQKPWPRGFLMISSGNRKRQVVQNELKICFLLTMQTF